MQLIGRPKDIFDIISAEFYIPSDFIIFSCHGEAGKICMSEYGDGVLLDNEPEGNIGADEIAKHLKISDTTIINLGCTQSNQSFCRYIFK